MTSVRLTVVALITGLLVAGPAQAKLELGDAAPALKVAEWVKGEPVDLQAGVGKTIYVVEFWATWCAPCRASIPHLTELQKAYKDKNVLVIGISDEPVGKVESFVKHMGDQMNYTVAVDRDQKTGEAYMAAAGLSGIPQAFIINKEGKIAWHGHPMQDMESILNEIIAGTYDLAAAREKMAKLDKLSADLEEAYAAENWDGMLQVAEKLNALDPSPERYHQIRFHALAMKGDSDGASSSGVALLEAVNDADTLNGFAWMLLTEEPFAGKYNPLALRVATKANKLSEGKNWSIVDTYARALFENGDVTGAIENQKSAIALAKDTSVQAIGQLKAALERYEKAAEEKSDK